MKSEHQTTRWRLFPIAAIFLLVIVFLAGRWSAGEPDALQSEDSMVEMDMDAMSDTSDREILYWRAPMDPNERYDEPGLSKMGMELVPVYADAGDGATISIDPVMLRNIGVRLDTAHVRELRPTIRTTGIFRMDERGEHRISLRVSGWVEKLYADFDGARIAKGDPLLDLYSPALIAAQEEFLLAVRMAATGTVDQQTADRLVAASRQRLAYLDMTTEQIDALGERGRPTRTITYFAPASGEVMHKQVALGEYVEAGKTLMDVVDLSYNWLMVDVYEQDLPWLYEGQPAEISIPYIPELQFTGQVDYIYHMLDDDSRAARARITLPGGHRARIKPGMFATVHLRARAAPAAPVVPEQAVLLSDDGEFVIEWLGQGRLRPIRVQTGRAADGLTSVMDGLIGGEVIVSSAQFLLDSEARLRGLIDAMKGSDLPPMSMDDMPDGPSD